MLSFALSTLLACFMCVTCADLAQMQRYLGAPHHNARHFVIVSSSCAARQSLGHGGRVPFITIFSTFSRAVSDCCIFEYLGSGFCFCTLVVASKYYYKVTLTKVTAAIYSTLCSDMGEDEDCMSYMPFIMHAIDRSPGRFLMYHMLLHRLPLSSDLIWQFRISLLRQFRSLMNVGLRVRQRRAWIRDVW